MIEKVAGASIGEILEGIERSSVYGNSIEDGIRYWERAGRNEDSGEDNVLGQEV